METILLAVLTAAAFFTRIYNLLAIPIFTDEAIYIRWAQIGLADPAHRYISLTDGKQPLFTWLMYPFLILFKDPLFAGRFVSVLSSIGIILGIYFTSKILFGRKTAVFASVIYLISPFFMVYDRLALMDSLLGMFAIWSLYLEIVLIKKIRLDVSLILGIVMGLGMLTKSSAAFFIYLLPFSLLLFSNKKKKNLYILSKWMGLCTLSVLITQIMYNSLRLSPWFYIINQKNHVFILTLKEFLARPFFSFYSNLYGMMLMLFGYLTIPVCITIIIGLFFGFIRKDLKIIFLSLWFFIPFFALAGFGKILFPRYMLSMVLPLFIIAAEILSKFSYFAWEKMKILLIIVPIVLVFPMYQTFIILTSPVDASIPQVDRNQLFDDWPSGTGVKDVITYLAIEAKDKKIVIATEGTFGLNPAVYEIYFGFNKNVEIHGYWPVSSVPLELLDKAKLYPTYLIFKERQDIPSLWPLELKAKYKRGKGNTYLLFYKVTPIME